MKNEMGRAYGTHGKDGWGGETRGKKPLGRSRRRWDDIKQDLEKQDEEA
jgi:hypothetical protein